MRELAMELVSLGHNVTVLTTRPKYNLAEYAPASATTSQASHAQALTIKQVRSAFLHNTGPVRKGLGQLWLTLCVAARGMLLPKVDAVLVYSPPLPLALSAIAFARWHNAKCVVNVQDFFPQNAIDLGVLRSRPLIKVLRWLESLVYRGASRLTVQSAANLAWLESCGYHRGVVVPNWFDFPAILRDEERVALRRLAVPKRFTVLFGGVMGCAQDIDVIIGAAELLREHDSIQFLLIGDGVEYAKVQTAIIERGLNNVYLRKFIDASEYRKLLGAVDVGLVTIKAAMKTPAVPSKTLGYFAAGLPVITAVNDESDLPKMVAEANAGKSVRAGDSAGIAEAIRVLWSDKGMAMRLGQNGQTYGRRNFGVRSAALVYLELFER